MDRPTVLTPKAQRALLAAIGRGSDYATACEAAGTTYVTFRRWRERYERGDEIAVRQFGAFFAAVGRLLAVAEMEAVRKVRAGAPGWRASAWFLERRFPKRWGRKYRAP